MAEVHAVKCARGHDSFRARGEVGEAVVNVH